MNSQLKVLFKTRGGHKEGMGDIMISLAMAEEFRKNGIRSIVFVVNENEKVEEIITTKGFTVIHEDNFYNSIQYHDIDILIANQLNTPFSEIEKLRKCVKMLVTIDDTGKSALLADLRFNVLYPIENAICDLSYIPLAPIFQQKHKDYKDIKEKVENILVLQGGSDTYGFIPKIVKSLSFLPNDIQVDVVLGPNFQHYDELEKSIRSCSIDLNIITGLTDLSELMLKADLAISAAGVSLFELACLGVPTIVVCAEEFEVATASRLEAAGFGVNLGFGNRVDNEQVQKKVKELIKDVEVRRNMSITGKRLIDGRGSQRMVEYILKLYSRAWEE
jgi:spore coat polysaccharide biosynthesis predicted glycosyltransferase SpsG